jgi:hypothetical protein
MRIQILFILLFSSCFQTEHHDSRIKKVRNDYCKILDTIVHNHAAKNSNEYLTNHIGILVKESKIYDNSHNGSAGCVYENDSLFYADIKKWREYFRCSSEH